MQIVKNTTILYEPSSHVLRRHTVRFAEGMIEAGGVFGAAA